MGILLFSTVVCIKKSRVYRSNRRDQGKGQMVVVYSFPSGIIEVLRMDDEEKA